MIIKVPQPVTGALAVGSSFQRSLWGIFQIWTTMGTMYHTVPSMMHCTTVLKTTGPSEHAWGPPKLKPKETFASYKLFVPVFCYTTKWFVISEFWSLKSSMKLSSGLAPEGCGGRSPSGSLSASHCLSNSGASVQFPFLCEDSSHTGLASVMTSVYPDDSGRPNSKQDHALRART